MVSRTSQSRRRRRSRPKKSKRWNRDVVPVTQNRAGIQKPQEKNRARCQRQHPAMRRRLDRTRHRMLQTRHGRGAVYPHGQRSSRIHQPRQWLVLFPKAACGSRPRPPEQLEATKRRRSWCAAPRIKQHNHGKDVDATREMNKTKQTRPHTHRERERESTYTDRTSTEYSNNRHKWHAHIG